MAAKTKFKTTIESHGKTATGFIVPPEVVESLNAGRRVPVRVTVGAYTYRSTVAPYRGVFMLPLAAEHREAAGVAAGQEVEVLLQVDTEPRVVEVPPDLQAALDADPAVSAAWDNLSYTHKKEHVRAIETAKSADTKKRRIDKVLGILD